VALNVCCVTPIFFLQTSQKEEQQEDGAKTRQRRNTTVTKEMTREPLRGSQRMCQQTRELYTQIQFAFGIFFYSPRTTI